MSFKNGSAEAGTYTGGVGGDPNNPANYNLVAPFYQHADAIPVSFVVYSGSSSAGQQTATVSASADGSNPLTVALPWRLDDFVGDLYLVANLRDNGPGTDPRYTLQQTYASWYAWNAE